MKTILTLKQVTWILAMLIDEQFLDVWKICPVDKFIYISYNWSLFIKATFILLL